MILRTLILGLAVIFFTNCGTWQKAGADRQVSGAGGQCAVNTEMPPMFNIIENNRERIVVVFRFFVNRTFDANM